MSWLQMKKNPGKTISFVIARSTFAAGACVLLGLPNVAQGAPQYQRLSYTGDTSTSITVTWNTTVDTDSEVDYGTATGSLGKKAVGTTFQANAGLGYVHEATLTGLQPSTKYYYVVGSATDGFSAEKSFVTGPLEHQDCGQFKFVFLGDNRPDPIFGGGENWPTILGQSVQQQPDFVLNGGDLVIDGDKVDQWLLLLGWTEKIAASLPFMPTIGNHDTGPGQGDTANYNQLFALPRSTGAHGSGTEDYYYFTYGNAIFVALSTEGFKTGSVPFAEQAAWLDEVLTNNPKKWKFVYFHKPAYTHEDPLGVSHAPNEEGQNASFVAVIDKHHVDVVLTSHNHWYERYEPSACGTKGTPGSSQPCSVGANNYSAGTVYYVSGGAGAFTIPGILCGTQFGRAFCAGAHHYVVFNVNNEVLKIDTWAAFPQTNQVIDTITITKGAVNCLPPDGGIADSGQDSAATADGPTIADAATPDSSGPAADTLGDAGSRTDAGTSAKPSSGCGCRVVGDGVSGTLVLLLLLGGLLWRRKSLGR